MSRTVFVSNMVPKHDYEPAVQFGGLRPITTGNYAIFQTERLMEEIATAIQGSSPEDFLLLSGSSVIAGLSIALWLQQHGKVNLLLYDKGKERYVSRTVEKKDLVLEIERAGDRTQDQGHSGMVHRSSR